jgi:hypothetical protein
MRLAILIAALFAMPALSTAKSETARIEIARGKQTLVTLAGEESAGQFTIWSGPGTTAGPPDGPGQMSTSDRDIADWLAGSVQPPRKLQVYEVRFYCAARGENARESLPSSLCYGVRYAIDRKSGRGTSRSRLRTTRRSRQTPGLSTGAWRAAGSAPRIAGKNWCGRRSRRPSRRLSVTRAIDTNNRTSTHRPRRRAPRSGRGRPFPPGRSS